MKKNDLLGMMTVLALCASLSGCGSKDIEDTLAEETVMENTEAIKEDYVPETVKEEEVTAEDEAEITYREEKSLYLINGAYGTGADIDTDSFERVNAEYNINKNAEVYYFDATLAGYAKDEISSVYIVSKGDEWSYVIFDAFAYLMKNENIMDEVKEEVAEAETETSKPASETSKTEKAPVVSEPVVNESVAEQPAVSDRYTPEEAIAIYRSIMEANGITWDPSIKSFASWGTGWIYLDKGWIDENAYSAVESYKMGDSVGNAWTKYYLEVTGSDENAVYITEWSCN